MAIISHIKRDSFFNKESLYHFKNIYDIEVTDIYYVTKAIFFIVK